MKESIRIEDAFLDMIENYQGIIHKVGMIYFKDTESRRENFQEVLYQLWRSYPELKNKNSIGSWIYRVAINTSVNKIKKDNRVSYKDKLPEQVSDDFLNDIEKREAHNMLYEAIERLSAIEKALIMLYLEEKEYGEIAEIMGMSKSNVGVKLMRIKEKLKEYLTE